MDVYDLQVRTNTHISLAAGMAVLLGTYSKMYIEIIYIYVTHTHLQP